MKKNLTLLAIAFGFYSSNAQEFIATEKYTVANERTIGQEEEGAARIDLVASEDISKPIALLNIADRELLEDLRITVLPDPDLEGIAEILKVELEYFACCTSTETYYFLVSNENGFTALPRIENLYCDAIESDTHYVFPSQANGQEGTILRAELQYSQNRKIKDIKVLRSFFWNDDDFEDQESSTAMN